MPEIQADYQQPELLIAGRFVASGSDAMPVLNPASGETLARLPLAGPQELDAALEAAQRTSAAWRARPPVERGRYLKQAAKLLRERAGAIARLVTLEQGKPLAQSHAEITMAADTLEWFAEEGRRAYGRAIPGTHGGVRYVVHKEPVGPVASLAPWNFPVTNAARKIGAALAAGCTCIHKPAEEAPASALAVARALVDAGLPEGVLSVVFGTPAEVSQHLIASPVIRKVSFTGSIPVGQHLMQLAASRGIRTTMELGGHAPVLVFDDADVDAVLDLSVPRKFANAGQICVSPTRFFVHDRIFDRFAEGFRRRTLSIEVGNGLDPRVQMGPLAHGRRLPAVQELVDDATARGARLLAGGRRIAGPGNFFEPTVLADLPAGTRLMNEEPFGPVALLNRFDDAEAAIAEANRLPFGLAAYAFTRSLATAQLASEALQAGMVGINNFKISLPDTPFGGVKESGHGAENGNEGLEACLVTKLVALA
ncbi:MAG TPA: NAD-dependent succinate-semialdehyde dehydrogenase [Ramlibacter sp.]|jgi:succinate-semialdehyde dehydrogenase/glutarate-semialdehyde dehydrogenase